MSQFVPVISDIYYIRGGSHPVFKQCAVLTCCCLDRSINTSFSVALKQLLHVFFIHYGLKYFVVSLFTVIKSFRHTPGIICVPTTYRLSFSFSLRADHLFVPLVKCILRCLLSWRKAENWPGPQLITSLNLLKAPSGFKLQTNAAVGWQRETGRCRMWT